MRTLLLPALMSGCTLFSTTMPCASDDECDEAACASGFCGAGEGEGERPEDWWDEGWQHRVGFDVDTGAQTGGRVVVTTFTVPPGVSIAADSFRLLEGDVERPFFARVDDDGAHGTLVFAETEPGPRRMHLYFRTTEEPPIGPPSFWVDLPVVDQSVAGVNYEGIGRTVGGTNAGLGLVNLRLGAENGEGYVGLLDALRIDGVTAFGSVASPTDVQLGAEAFTADVAPTLRVNSAELRVVEQVVRAGDARIRLLYAIDTPGQITIVRDVVNTGATDLVDVVLYTRIDVDLEQSTDDRAAVDAGARLIEFTDDNAAETVVIGQREPDDAIAINTLFAIDDQIRNSELDGPENTQGDVAGAFSVRFSGIAPGARAQSMVYIGKGADLQTLIGDVLRRRGISLIPLGFETL